VGKNTSKTASVSQNKWLSCQPSAIELKIFFTHDGSGQFFDVWVGLGWVGSATSESVKFPPNISFLHFFCLQIKKFSGLGQKKPGSRAGQPLIYCGVKGMLGSGQDHSFLSQTNSVITFVIRKQKEGALAKGSQHQAGNLRVRVQTR